MGTRVFVKGISNYASKRDIDHFFSGFGPIRSMFLRPNGSGHVEYENWGAANSAVNKLNGLQLCGKKVRVEHDKNSRRQDPVSNTRQNTASNRKHPINKPTSDRSNSTEKVSHKSKNDKRSPFTQNSSDNCNDNAMSSKIEARITRTSPHETKKDVSNCKKSNPETPATKRAAPSKIPKAVKPGSDKANKAHDANILLAADSESYMHISEVNSELCVKTQESAKFSTGNDILESIKSDLKRVTPSKIPKAVKSGLDMKVSEMTTLSNVEPDANILLAADSESNMHISETVNSELCVKTHESAKFSTDNTILEIVKSDLDGKVQEAGKSKPDDNISKAIKLESDDGTLERVKPEHHMVLSNLRDPEYDVAVSEVDSEYGLSVVEVANSTSELAFSEGASLQPKGNSGHDMENPEESHFPASSVTILEEATSVLDIIVAKVAKLTSDVTVLGVTNVTSGTSAPEEAKHTLYDIYSDASTLELDVKVSETAKSDSDMNVSETAKSKPDVKVSETAKSESYVKVSETANSESDVKVSETAKSESDVHVSEATKSESDVRDSETAKTESDVKVTEAAVSTLKINAQETNIMSPFGSTTSHISNEGSNLQTSESADEIHHIDMCSLKGEFESSKEWNLRKTFLERNIALLPFERLICLSRCYVNMTIHGCSYPLPVMREVNERCGGLLD